MSNAMTPFVYIGIQIALKKARQKYMWGLPSNPSAALEACCLGEEIKVLEKMQNAIPRERR
jgi:hypothetical protein